MPSLAALLVDIKKTFSKTNPDLIFDPRKVVEFLTSGSLIFDAVTGGGFPKGRLTELFGMEHSGKSSLLYAALAAVQKAGGVGILIDAENAWDPVYAKNTFGLIHDGVHFAVFQPDNIEEIDNLYEKLKTLDRIDLLGFDSVDAMKPKAQIEGSLEDERRIGAHAQAMSRFVAKMRIFARQRKFPIVFINQMRTTITTDRASQNVGTGSGYNPQEQYTVTGGFALRFYASVRVKLEYGGKIEDEMEQNQVTGETEKTRIGNTIRFIDIKNKCHTPFLKAEGSFIFPTAQRKGGWSNDLDTMNLLKKRGRIKQQSTRFVYNGLNIKEWSNVGSKKASEEMFLTSPDLIADARALLSSFLKPGSQESVLETVALKDLDQEDLKGQDGEAEAEVMISLEVPAEDDEPSTLVDANPVQEITL